jgi:DNA-binding NarL/FixJ family response regulator
MTDDGNLNSNSAGLTDRELQILARIVSGHSTKQIADDLRITFKTACCHRLRIMQKVKAHNVVQLMRFEVENRLTGFSVAMPGSKPASQQ